MPPKTPALPFHRAGDRFLSAELKLKAPSRDLEQDLALRQLLPQLALVYGFSYSVFQGGGDLNAEQGTAPATPSVWDGTSLSSEAHRRERDLLASALSK